MIFSFQGIYIYKLETQKNQISVQFHHMTRHPKYTAFFFFLEAKNGTLKKKEKEDFFFGHFL